MKRYRVSYHYDDWEDVEASSKSEAIEKIMKRYENEVTPYRVKELDDDVILFLSNPYMVAMLKAKKDVEMSMRI